MPVFESTENGGAYMTSISEWFSKENAMYWIPVVVGILLVLFLVYRYYYCTDTKLSIKRY